MKTKQAKEDQDKSLDEETVIEPKTRARKKASDIIDEEKNKVSQDEPKPSKETKKTQPKPKAIVKKRPLGIRKALRSKKAAIVKEKVKNVIKNTRGRKVAIKTEPESSQDRETVPLIPAAEIKKEPVEDTTPNSRSSSPKTAGRRQRLSSDMIMMKSMLSDSPSSLVLGPRTSPYSMRSERSNSPSLFEGKNLRSTKPRKVKNNLLSEVVIKEQKKRRRLLSDSKTAEAGEATEDCKKLKRGRSCSRDGSEISKCSDNTESDLSLSETLNDSDNRELNKKLDKTKTDLDVDIENNIQISTIDKVPSLNVDSKLAESKLDPETTSIVNEKNKKLSLKRSTSLDSDNNNSNRVKVDTINTSGIEEKLLLKTENDTLFEARSSILTSMSKTFNSKEIAKNMRKARRGRKAATEGRRSTGQAKNTITSTITNEPIDDKHETIETLSKDIDDLIKNLDQNIDGDHHVETTITLTNTKTTDTLPEQTEAKSAVKFYGLTKPLNPVDDNSVTPETPVKDKDSATLATNENTPSKNDESDSIKLHYEEDSVDKTENSRNEITYKSTVASIDKLMDRLKEFEEFDKRRQRQESETKTGDNKPMMVTNDVVLIPKSGADIKPLKDIQSVRSPERPIEKENVLSCFENNSAISIVKRDQVRKSIDVDLPSSVTLIKRNSFSARKESTSSNHSRESDAISIFEKSLGKDVTLTEIRKSVDKSAAPTQVDLHQFATLHPNSSTQNVVLLDSSQISITPRLPEAKISGNDVQIIAKRKSRESLSRKSSESTNDSEEKLATIEKIKSPTHQSPAVSIIPAPISITPTAIGSSATPITITPAPLAILPAAVVTTPTSGSIISPVAIVPTPLAITTPVAIASGPLAIAAAPIAITPTPVAVTPSPVAVTSSPVVVTPAPVSVKSPEDTPVETEALPPPIEDIKPVTDVPNASETPETDQKIEALESIADGITKVEELITENVESPKSTKTEDLEKMEVDNSPEESSKETIEKSEEITPKEESKASVSEASTRGPGRPPKPRNSIEAQPGPSNTLNETPESQKRKENVLRTLGLLTHKAAKEAKIEKLKEKERIYANNKGKATKSGDYTGTLKTVIKLNRSGGEREKKKHRSSLKMTFQKSKYRAGKPVPEMGEAAAEDDTFYTIERREAAGSATAEGGQRKSHYSNRLNNHEEAAPEPTEPKETLNLVIPEKASSFSIHPGRLCMDQCFYCGGKFGLFDTPCHIAQIKSSERQKKVLDNEEKLTIDSCLCDACYRHVDRRANCPSYRKRPPPHSQPKHPDTQPMEKNKTSEKPQSPPLEDESDDEGTTTTTATTTTTGGRAAPCHVEGCSSFATHSIRRKWLIKMRTSVNRVLKLRTDYPGLHTLPLCAEHHRALAPLMCCVMCHRRLTKHHNLHFIHHGYQELNPILESLQLPIQFVERPVLCKACRYYCTLLQRPGHNDQYANSYRRKLLQIYNIELPPEPDNQQPTEPMETSQDDAQNVALLTQNKKKQRNKSKQRKSTEPDTNSENSEQTNESTPEKEQKKEDMKPLEEDIESLISSNKILVPSAVKASEATPSDGSENEGVYDMEPPHVHVDKQTELQYLLQKQNNPAQFLHNAPNLTQKQKNLLKMQSLSGIQKTGHQHRINEKNAKRIQKLGQMMLQKEKLKGNDEETIEGIPVLKNITLNEECTIESIPNKRPADITTLKNKWQMSESFTQVKKNLSELSKKLTVEKEPKKPNDAKYSNPVKRLETNPSISVRELFPGEEEMNLQCNIEFNNVKGVTPEGWEKCNSTVQYDLETKKLWTELQRPYGNQSSFLRHLVILEKYFRSGDLVLSHAATPSAANYTDSVQNRLRAYDNIPCERPVSLVEFRKKPSINGKSLLKSNNTEDKEAKKFKPPAPITGKVKKDKSKSKPLPPELIAINTPNAQGRKAIQNVLHNIQQLVKGVSASDPTEVAAAPLPPPKFDPPKEKPEKKAEKKEKSPEKGKSSSKPWRPTLMPITEENLRKIAREPLEKAVDGRLLPKLVIVMSSGKRYHITLQDYNKMCIMRREKLQQLEDGKKKRPSIEETTVVTELQPSTMLGNGGTLVQNITEEKEKKEDLIGSNAATILKNVGLKNITIAPIPAKTATITSQTFPAPTVSSPSLLVTSTPIKIPQLGPAVSITSETVLTPNLPIMTSQMIMPKIPKSLTVIPQTTVTSIPQNVVVASTQVNPETRP